MEDSRNKLLVRLKLCRVPRSVMEPHAVLPRPSQSVDPSLVQLVRAV